MKRLIALLMIIVGTTAYGATLNTNTSCCPCPSMDRCCGEFCVDGELLIWKVSNCPDDWALILGPTNELFSASPSFDLGFRVNARYDRECWFVDGRYTFFESSDLDIISRPTPDIFVQGFALQFPGDLASHRIRFGYQDANARLALRCINNPCCQLYSWLEGRYANITSKRSLLITRTSIQGSQFSKFSAAFEAGGLGAGLGIQGQFLSCIQLSTEISAFGLFGEQRGAYNRGTLGVDQEPANYRSVSAFVPGFDLRAKVAYTKTYCNMDFSLYFAWEINEYFDAELMTDPPIGLDATQDPVLNTGRLEGNRLCSNLGFGGPSVGFTVCY